MATRILEKIFSLAVFRGKTLLAVMGGLTIVLALFIPNLKISSSQRDLIPADHEDQARYLAFMKEFGLSDNLIVVLEGETSTLKASSELFARELKKETKWVKSIHYRMDIDFLMKQAPLYIPVDKLKDGLSFLNKNHNSINQLRNTNNIYSLLKMMDQRIRQVPTDADQEMAILALESVNYLFEEWKTWIVDPSHNKIGPIEELLVQGNETTDMIRSEGYLFSRDFSMQYLLVQPGSSNDDMTYLEPFMAAMRGACDRVFAQYPNLKGKVKVAFTGMPAHIYTETETIFSDVGKAGLVSIIFVALILLFGFGSLRKMIIGVVPLASGLIITTGLISLTLGKLNLISSSFLAVLFGIGIDFGIYLIRRTEEELGNGFALEDAVHKAVVITGKGIVTGGLTTGFAFLAISFSEFSGYSQLGITAGMGILIVMMTTFLMMPALLLNMPIEARKYDVNKVEISTKGPHSRERLWVIVGLSMLFIVFGIFGAAKNTLDYNVFKLLPRDTESTVYQEKMEEKSDLKMSFAAVTTKDMAELKELTKKIAQLKEVSKVESFARLLPDRQKEKINLIYQYRRYLNNFTIPYIRGQYRGSDYLAILGSLTSFFEDAQEKAFAGGQSKLVKPLETLINNIYAIEENFTGDKRTQALLRTNAFEKELFKSIEFLTTLVQDWLKVKELKEEHFPEQMLKRLKSPNGNYVAYVFPNGSIWNVDFLDTFVKKVKKISPEVTGFPVTHRVYVRQAADAVVQAMFYSLIIVLVLLFLDFKRPVAVILALVPLAVGLLWMQGVLYALKVTYNVANIAGLPLLLGLGVVYGVHIVHRWLEKPDHTAFIASRTTGRGVSFAALTTITGLFSIVFARHGGVSTFGIILLTGISLCLLSALVVLPAVIDLIFMKKKEGTEDE